MVKLRFLNCVTVITLTRFQPSLTIPMRRPSARSHCPSSTKSGFRQYPGTLAKGQTFHLAGDSKGEPATWIIACFITGMFLERRSFLSLINNNLSIYYLYTYKHKIFERRYEKY